MATMDPGQRGFGQQRQFNIPDLPFKDLGRQGPAGAGNAPFINQMQRMFPQGQMPPELLELLMAQFFGGQGAPMGARRSPMGGVGQRQAMQAAQRGGQRPPMGGGSPPMGGGRPPMGGGRPPMGRPPMGGPQRGGQRPPMGGGRPPVIKIEDLVRALSGGGGQRQAPQANMPVPQARR